MRNGKINDTKKESNLFKPENGKTLMFKKSGIFIFVVIINKKWNNIICVLCINEIPNNIKLRLIFFSCAEPIASAQIL